MVIQRIICNKTLCLTFYCLFNTKVEFPIMTRHFIYKETDPRSFIFCLYRISDGDDFHYLVIWLIHPAITQWPLPAHHMVLISYMWRHQMEIFSALLVLSAGNSPVNSPHKGQWRGALVFPLICTWINGWVNNREAGDLRHHRVTVMK